MVMRPQGQTVVRAGGESLLATNKVLRNTYFLLSLTLLFSAVTAGIAMVTNARPLGLFTLLIYFGLLFMTERNKNSASGLFWVFALTGFLGYTLGPMLSYYIAAVPNGSQLVMLALGGTGVIFFTMSGIALATGKNFSFLGNFLMIGILVAFIGGLAAYFMNIPGLMLAVSCMFLVLSSVLILWETSNIVNGGETNYISATVTLYVAIYNIFTSLLHLLSFFTGRE